MKGRRGFHPVSSVEKWASEVLSRCRKDCAAVNPELEYLASFRKGRARSSMQQIYHSHLASTWNQQKLQEAEEGKQNGIYVASTFISTPPCTCVDILSDGAFPARKRHFL